MDFEKIKKNVKKDGNGCWNWQMSLSSTGYGQLKENKVYWSAHRYSYASFYGENPKNLIIRHLCHNKTCCNPEHLEAGTYQDNWYDSEETHRSAANRRSKRWLVDGIEYDTCKDVVNNTGICMNTVIKYTNNGVFDLDGYRKACKTANCTPKV